MLYYVNTTHYYLSYTYRDQYTRSLDNFLSHQNQPSEK